MSVYLKICSICLQKRCKSLIKRKNAGFRILSLSVSIKKTQGFNYWSISYHSWLEEETLKGLVKPSGL